MSKVYQPQTTSGVRDLWGSLTDRLGRGDGCDRKGSIPTHVGPGVRYMEGDVFVLPVKGHVDRGSDGRPPPTVLDVSTTGKLRGGEGGDVRQIPGFPYGFCTGDVRVGEGRRTSVRGRGSRKRTVGRRTSTVPVGDPSGIRG